MFTNSIINWIIKTYMKLVKGWRNRPPCSCFDVKIALCSPRFVTPVFRMVFSLNRPRNLPKSRRDLAIMTRFLNVERMSFCLTKSRHDEQITSRFPLLFSSVFLLFLLHKLLCELQNVMKMRLTIVNNWLSSLHMVTKNKLIKIKTYPRKIRRR